MWTRVQKWGNSLALRIPKALASEIGLRHDTPVKMSLVKGKLIVETVSEPTYTLEDLVGRITEDNIHSETDSGTPIGRETW